MMKSVLTALLSALFAFSIFQYSYSSHTKSSTTGDQPAFERVMSTKTLRCGYIFWPPEFSKDPNTGAFSGIDYDITMEAAKRLGLTVAWTEELNFTTMADGLKNNRYDAICFSLYRDSPRASWSEMSVPLFFSGHGVFVRKEDPRFDGKDTSVFNSPEITIGTIDGELSAMIARKDFPRAKVISLPQTSSPAEAIMTVTTHKADVTFVNVNSASLFDKANPNLIKNLDTKNPISFFSHGFAYNKGEVKLKNMFDIVFEEMQNQGITPAILKKNEIAKDGFYAVAQPYVSLPE